VTIDFFNPDDLRALLEKLNKQQATDDTNSNTNMRIDANDTKNENDEAVPVGEEIQAIDDRPVQQKQQEENEEIYSLKNFSL
jgi:hypothetical protein